MSPMLEQRLLSCYPSLFPDNLDPAKNLMGWGFACEDACYPILDALCATICWHMEQGEMPRVEVLQIKEKFGELRFRFRGGDARTHALADFARRLSVTTPTGTVSSHETEGARDE